MVGLSVYVSDTGDTSFIAWVCTAITNLCNIYAKGGNL